MLDITEELKLECKKLIVEGANDFFNKLEQQERIKLERVNKLFTIYGVSDELAFDNLMKKILSKQKIYDDRHYKSYTDRPLHITNLIWEFVQLNALEIDIIDDLILDFPSTAYEYFGYQFIITHGQGSVLSIYHKNELKYRS